MRRWLDRTKYLETAKYESQKADIIHAILYTYKCPPEVLAENNHD